MSDCDVVDTTGFYVDVENLQGDAQEILSALLDGWPSEKIPTPSMVNLYVPADAVELWKIWATDFSSRFQFNVHGIQHYTVAQSKNSADMAIAVDALADLFNGIVSNVAVCSDDSDFISLLAKIRKENCTGSFPGSTQALFLWILTGRSRTKTPNIERFFPDRFVHVVDGSFSWNEPPAEVILSPSVPQVVTLSESTGNISDKEKIIRAIVGGVALGPFKATECKSIVNRAVPNNKMAKLPDNQFGKQFVDNIWPELAKVGVKLKSSKPNRYEMTEEAKTAFGIEAN